MGDYIGSFIPRSLSAALSPYFVRTSIASDTSAAGVLSTVTSGNPAYDGVNGIILEEARTNLLTYSEQFDTAAWTKAANAAVTANQATAPDGTLTADLVEWNGSSPGHIYQLKTVVAATVYTASLYFKPIGTTWFRILYYDGGSNQCRMWFNAATMTAGTISNGGVATGATGRIEALANGWYRLQVSGAHNNGTSGYIQLTPQDADGSTALVASSAYVWGGQLEAGAFASSYIPTVAAAVVRTVSYIGAIPLTGMGLASQTNEYSFAVAIKMSFASTVTPDGSNATFGGLGFDSGNRLYFSYSNAGQLRVTASVAGVATSIDATLTWAAGDVLILAFSKGATNGIIFRAQGTTATNTTASMKAAFASALTVATLNVRPIAMSAAAYGAYKGFRVWDRALTQAELEALTPADFIPNVGRKRMGIGIGIGI